MRHAKIVAGQIHLQFFCLWPFLISYRNDTTFSPSRCLNLQTNILTDYALHMSELSFSVSTFAERSTSHLIQFVTIKMYLLTLESDFITRFHYTLFCYFSIHALFTLFFNFSLSLFFLKATLVRFYSFHFSYYTHHTFPQMYSDHSELNWYLRIGLLGFCMLHFRSLVYITLTNKTVLYGLFLLIYQQQRL